jgi:hypothetical protein
MKVRKMICCASAIACVSMLIAGAAVAQGKVSTTLDTTYLNKLVWRGSVLSTEPVVAVSMKMDFNNGLTYSLTGFDTTERVATGPAGKVIRNDHNVNYATQLFGKKLDLGATYYSYKVAGMDRTAEVYVKVPFGCMFNPVLGINYDCGASHGYYATVGGGYSFAVPVVNKLDLGVSVGYGDKKFTSLNKAGLVDGVATLSTTIKLGEDFALVPSVSYSTIIDSDFRDQMVDPDNTIFGATLQASF